MSTESDNGEAVKTSIPSKGAEIAARNAAKHAPRTSRPPADEVTDQDIFDLAKSNDMLLKAISSEKLYWPERIYERPFFQAAAQVAADTGTHRDAVALELLRRHLTVLRTSVTGWSAGKPLHLSLSIVLCAISGGGKSTAFSTAAKAAPFPDLPGEDCPSTHPHVTPDQDWKIEERGLGSGEGILSRFVRSRRPKDDEKEAAAADGRTLPETVLVRHATRLHITDSEGSTLIQIRDRRGSTLEQALLRASFGEILDNNNSDENGRNRIVEPGTYRATTGFGGQPMVLDAIFSDESKGYPQRQLLAMATGPLDEDFDAQAAQAELDRLDSGIGDIGAAPVLLPGVGDEQRKFFASLMGHLEQLDGVTLTACPRAEKSIDQMIRLSKHGATRGIDHHRPAIVAALAFALALVDRRTEMNDEDWALACLIWSAHVNVRDHMIDLAGIVRRIAEAKENETRARAAAMSARAVEMARDVRPVVRQTGESILKRLRQEGKPLTKKAIKNAVLNPKRRGDWEQQRGEDARDLLTVSLAYLLDAGEIRMARTKDGVAYTL